MKVSDELVAEALKTSVASVHEAAGRAGALPADIRPIDMDSVLCGRAFTVRCPSGDNLWIHKALSDARPGDVLVIDAGPNGEQFGYWGEIMATAAIASGLAGIVISGGVRDVKRLRELGLPTFSASITMRGTIKDPEGDGALRDIVRMGEVAIRTGDFVMGDADGLIAISPERAAAAVPAAIERDQKEHSILQRISAGAKTIDVYKL